MHDNVEMIANIGFSHQCSDKNRACNRTGIQQIFCSESVKQQHKISSILSTRNEFSYTIVVVRREKEQKKEKEWRVKDKPERRILCALHSCEYTQQEVAQLFFLVHHLHACLTELMLLSPLFSGASTIPLFCNYPLRPSCVTMMGINICESTC